MTEETLDLSPNIDAEAPITPSGADAVVPDAAPAKVDATPDASAPVVKPEAKTDAKPDAKPDAKADVVPAWGDDWREKAAKGDTKKLARLGRYASPEAVIDALVSAQNRIAQGIPALKKDATPEQIKEYRDSLGIPETPDKYDLSGSEFSNVNKELIADFLKSAHDTNQTPEQVKTSIMAYQQMVEKVNDQRSTQDMEIKAKTEDNLRGEWGTDFRRNLNLVNSFLDTAPQGFKEAFLTGRLGDGTPIGSSPEALRWLLQIELERNPTATVTPGAGANMAQSVDDEISKIEKTMRDNRTAYNKDEKMQSRYRQLIEYQLTQKKKAA